MSSLRSMMDGVGSLIINSGPVIAAKGLKVQQDVMIRRSSNRSGPSTREVLVGRIMSMGTSTAVVAIQQPGSVIQRKEIRLTDLSPLTAKFKRDSVRFKQQFNGIAARI